jgi:hypothetical protein
MTEAEERRLHDTILGRLRDYSAGGLIENRRRLIEAWREAHPEAVSEPPSRAHRPLDLIHVKTARERPEDPDEVWVNDIYDVTLRRRPDKVFGTREGLIQLGISAHEGTARHDWREFQWIKNQLAGAECEAFELYPAESRLMDPSNYYSLWCFPGLRRIKVGNEDPRRVLDATEALAPQRGFEK